MPRPDQEEPVVFDLVEDGADGAQDDGSDGPGADEAGAGRALRLPRLPRLSRRGWLRVGAAVLAVAVTLTAVDLLREQRRAELMAGSPVGVVSLSSPPEETWSLPYDRSGASVAPGLDQQVVVMDGLLVLPPATVYDAVAQDGGGPGEGPPGFDGVVAVDPASGEIAWRVPVGEEATCAPAGYDATLTTDVLTCVHGPAGEREIVAIGADGAARTRPADEGENETVFPGPDGSVVRARRTGPPPRKVVCEETGVCTPREVSDGRDVRVVLEDATTGTERWRADVAFTPVDAIACAEHGDGPEATVDADRVSVTTSARSVVLEGCGVYATFALGGARIDQVDALGDVWSWVQELGPGRFAVGSASGRGVVVDEEGDVVTELDGSVKPAPASPDAPGVLWFVDDPAGNGFDAVRADGTVVWSERYGTRVLLTTRDAVVVERGPEIVGLDPASGAELWTWRDDEPQHRSPFRAVTDGETVAVAFWPQELPGTGELVALDVRAGTERWRTGLDGTVVAVGGRLVEVSDGGLHGLG